jgi:hypothetical protein
MAQLELHGRQGGGDSRSRARCSRQSIMRDVHPRLRRVEVQVARAVAEPPLAAHRQIGQRRELAVLEVVDLHRARVLRLGGFGAVASCDYDRRTIAGHGQHLVREDAHVDPSRLRHLRADRAVGVDAMHGDVARIVVADECIRAGGVHAVVDRALRQCPRFPVQLQRAARVDAHRAQPMDRAWIGRVARCGIAGGHVQVLPRWMRPDVLHVGRQRNRCAPRERGVVDIHVPVGELVADALI